jgi:copper resistance protein C
VVISHDQTPVAVSSLKTEPGNQKVLIVTPAQPLPAGTYQVKWNAVSVDTHKSAGDYSFTVSH